MSYTRIDKKVRRDRRRNRIRSRIAGTAVMPRLSIFRSSKYTYAQLIDDTTGVTLASVSSKGISKGTKQEQALVLGEKLAEAAQGKKIAAAVFDRGGYKYHGRVKAVADGARKKGLKL